MRLSKLDQRLPIVVALLVTVAAYIPSFHFYFRQDDWAHITIISRPGFNPWAFGGWFYRPLFLIVFHGMLKAFGTNAFPWHVVELALHLVNVLLVYRLARKLGLGAIGAAAGAMAFGVFPLSTDAVGWLCAISGLMAAFCGLVAANIALETRIHPVLRGILCAAIWTVGVFSKEEAACLILVIPFLPLAARIKQTRRQWIGWGASCLLFLVGLWLIIHCEQQCSQNLGNPNARITVRILSKSVGFVGWISSITSLAATASLLSAAMLAIIPIGLWRRYSALRPGLLWLCAGGYALGVTMGSLGPSARYAYVPSIGLGLCLAILMDRLASNRRPLSVSERMALALVVCCVAGEVIAPYAAVALSLVIFFTRNDPTERESPEKGALVGLLAAGVVCRSLDRTMSQLMPFQMSAVSLVVVSLSLAMLIVILLKRAGNAVRDWPAMALCSLIVFSTYSTGILELTIAVLFMEGLAHKAQPIMSIKRYFSVDRHWMMKCGAAIIAAAVVAPWFIATHADNEYTMSNALRTKHAVNATAVAAKRLPRGATVEVLDAAGVTGAEPAIWRVTTGMVAERPDVHTTSRILASTKPDELPKPGNRSSYGIFVAPDGRARVIRPDQPRAH